jgi:acetyltransferase-like isoleucine patch superfamily enzyme
MLRSITKEFIQWETAFLPSIPGLAKELPKGRYDGYNHGSAVRVLRAVAIFHPRKLFNGTDTCISSGTQMKTADRIRIGKSVLIGPKCVMLPGATIEKEAVIAAGAAVKKSCHASNVVAEVPERMIGNRND